MPQQYTWWTLSVGKVNHALETDSPELESTALCGREGQFSPGAWRPGDKDKPECRNCTGIMKARELDSASARSMIFRGR